MKVLIVEDDFTSRKLLQGILSRFGQCDIAVNGVEAIEAYRQSLHEGGRYDLICMDIMMPYLDGHEAVMKIREMEAAMGIAEDKAVKVIFTTAVGDAKNITRAYFKGKAYSYLIKPIDTGKLIYEVRKAGLIGDE